LILCVRAKIVSQSRQSTIKVCVSVKHAESNTRYHGRPPPFPVVNNHRPPNPYNLSGSFLNPAKRRVGSREVSGARKPACLGKKGHDPRLSWLQRPPHAAPGLRLQHSIASFSGRVMHACIIQHCWQPGSLWDRARNCGDGEKKVCGG